MQDTIQQTKDNFLRAKARIVTSLNATPDDRINWSPSPTSRTPLHLVAHSAQAVKAIADVLQGQRFGFDSTAEADKCFREWERQFTTRVQALDLLEVNCDYFLDWLDELTAERFNATVELAFGFPAVPVPLAMSFPATHMNDHAAQIDYMQTIYGDHVWHGTEAAIKPKAENFATA